MANDIPDWAVDKPQAAPAWATAPATKDAVPSWAQGSTKPVATSQPGMNNPDANVRKFLNFLSKAEGAGYNTIVGGKTFTDFSRHPNVVGVTTKDGPSTAAGAYQITGTTYKRVANKLGITDFSEASQDKIAIELLREKGAYDDVSQGNWQGAINKIGGTWASLPSSPYGQTKRTMEWSLAQLTGSPTAPGMTTGAPYQGYAAIRKDVDPASLNNDADWIKASTILYQMWEKKPFKGEQKDIAEWGKDSLGNFNFDLVSMAQIAATVAKGTDEEKKAFLYMMDTYDNTQWSWEGARRGWKAGLTDPTNLIGIGTLGVATAGKFVGRTAAKEAAKNLVVRSMARTGIAAGIDGAVVGATSDAIKQSVEVSAGRRSEIDLSQVGTKAAVGAVAGVVLGTAADAAVAKVVGVIKGSKATPKGTKAPPAATRVEPVLDPGVPPPPVVNPSGRVEPTMDAVVPPAATPDPAAVTPRDPNLGSTLTPDELAQASARQQPGRLEADDVVPEIPAGTKPIDLPPAQSEGVRLGKPVDMNEQGAAAASVVDQLRSVETKDIPAVMESLRNRKDLGLDDIPLLARGVQDYAKEIKVEMAEILKKLNVNPDSPEAPQLTARLADLEARDAAVMADDAIGTLSGVLLRQRQEGLPGMTGLTPESIAADQKIPIEEARQVWAEMVTKAEQSVEAQKITREFDTKAQEAIDNGDLAGAAKIALEKREALSGLTEEAAKGSSSVIAKLTELAISNVFTIKTVMVNLIPSGVKTVVIPGLKLAMTDPFDKAARAEAGASYSAMRSSFGAALQAAKAAYKYEQALLTRDGMRLVEGELAWKGKTGGAIRVFPRILNASDEFLSRINYDSFVAGKAASEATIEGMEKGLKGKELDAFVKEATSAALDASRKIDSPDELVQPIINKGMNLGLSGDDLTKWVEKEAMKNPEALRKGTDEEALNFVRDVLYKKKFSGEGFASRNATAYENWVKENPSLKLVIGQLFFRTPIRVFEEGVRLTPGIQLLAPNFISDLAGKNGTMRQVRAQAESMTSLAVAGAVLSLYAQGRITGDGAYSDWKQQRTRTDGPLPEPYTLKMSDGSTWSFRSFDPIATPVKIMINGLERMDRLRLREAQGEFVEKSEFDKAQAYLTVGTTAMAAAIRDANLVAGVNGTISFFENLADPERKEDAMLKMLGEKLFLLVPNTLHKIAKDNDPQIKDPALFWQVIDEKLARPFGQNIDGVKTAYSYDPLGNVRRLADTGSLWNVFSTSSMEERGKGMTPEGQFVLQEMDRLARVTGATFTAPTKHRELGEMDLRGIISSDGKSTLYDVWQKNYKDLNPDQILAPILREALPDGTFKQKGDRVEVIQQTIKDLQDAAFYKVMSQEKKIIDEVIKRELYKAKAQSGQLDSKVPY